MEDYLDRFLFEQNKCGTTIDVDLAKTIFLRGIITSSLDVLNLMEKYNVTTLTLDDIVEL